jgi:hypothetical protein
MCGQVDFHGVFPGLPELGPTIGPPFSAETTTIALPEGVGEAAANGTSRYAINGIGVFPLTSCGGSWVALAATDGKCLSVTFAESVGVSLQEPLVIPIEFVPGKLMIKNGQNLVNVKYDDHGLAVELTGFCRRKDGSERKAMAPPEAKFPPIGSVLPPSSLDQSGRPARPVGYDAEITLDVSLLLKVAKAVGSAADEPSVPKPVVKIAFDPHDPGRPIIVIGARGIGLVMPAMPIAQGLNSNSWSAYKVALDGLSGFR